MKEGDPPMAEQLPFDGKVAIVGMALRAPGASNVDEFWSLISEGRVSEAPRATRDGWLQPRQIDRLAEFDANVFGMQPAEALLADPQLRASLELSWQALENAGVDPERHPGKIGVFAGCGRDDYRRKVLDKDPSYDQVHGQQQISIVNDRDFFASNLAYRLNLKGPAMTIQTACSTSLVATHIAIRSLLTGECDLAIAGGITIQIPDMLGYQALEGGIYSRDGKCRPFVEGSDGTVPASGGGFVVLCRSQDLEKYRLTACAVIAGSAINNDGSGKMNFAAPVAEGHEAVIREALDFAGIGASEIDFVQAHGTGTRLGDEIELKALRRTYGVRAKIDSKPCAIGSIKANVGHTDTGAGILGLIACAKALQEHIIPPTPSQEGDGTDLLSVDDQSDIYIPRQSINWQKSGGTRKAAVSSLGLGGANAHIVLEEANLLGRDLSNSQKTCILTLSAASGTALQIARDQLADFLQTKPDYAPAMFAGTLWSGRQRLIHRWAETVASQEEAIQCLRDQTSDSIRHPQHDPKLGILLQGQGERIGKTYTELLHISPNFRQEFILMRDVIADAGGDDILKLEKLDSGDELLQQTKFVQPLVFATQIAFLRSLKISANHKLTLAGHSLGELVAAIFGGLMSDEDAAAAVVMRARLMDAAPEGSMVAVKANLPQALLVCSDYSLEIAAVLSPDTHVLAGSVDSVQKFIVASQTSGMAVTLLPAKKAFHTTAMQAAASDYAEFLKSVTLRRPKHEVASYLGGSLSAELAIRPNYWAEQISTRVNMDAALESFVSTKPHAVLDVGPGRGLSNLLRNASAFDKRTFPVFALSKVQRRSDAGLDHSALPKLWEAGFNIELPVSESRSVELPTYPFEDTRYWPDPSPLSLDPATNSEVSHVHEALQNATEVEANASPTLASIQRIWSEAFGRPEVHKEDDFFDIGGTSLHATQILRRVSDECAVKVRLHDLYDYPVLSDFAAYVSEQRQAQDTR
jgi:acyl transferase domain-containing protein